MSYIFKEEMNREQKIFNACMEAKRRYVQATVKKHCEKISRNYPSDIGLCVSSLQELNRIFGLDVEWAEEKIRLIKQFQRARTR